MRIEELAKAYRRNAEEVLRSSKYDVKAKNQAYILLKRSREGTFDTCKEKS